MITFLTRTIGGIPVDVVINENHTSEMKIADHPVERGVKVSDHAWREPRKVELECYIDGPGIFDAYDALLRVQEEAEPFDLVTGLKLYENMLIQALYPIRDKDYARGLKFNATLQEVIIVSPSSPAGGGIGGTFGIPAGGIGPFGGLMDLGIGLASGAVGSLIGSAGTGFGDLSLDIQSTVLDSAVAVIDRGEVQAREIVAAALPSPVLAAFAA